MCESEHSLLINEKSFILIVAMWLLNKTWTTTILQKTALCLLWMVYCVCVQSVGKAKAGCGAGGHFDNQDGGTAAKWGDDTVSDVPAVRGCLHLCVRTGRTGTGAVQRCKSTMCVRNGVVQLGNHVSQPCVSELGLVQFRDVSPPSVSEMGLCSLEIM